MAKNNNTVVLPEVLPQHVAFIMDGNGRWAKKRMLPRKMGHAEGVKTFKTILRYCRRIGLKNVSFYAFSTENWKRSKDEVDALMNLFRKYIVEAKENFCEETRMIFIGDKSGVPDDIRKMMTDLEEDTKHFDKMNLMVAINYGGRDEIVHSARQLAMKVQSGELKPEDITESMMSENMFTAGIPDVDLLIRPSGEFRISNFLLWQSAYAEFYFSDVLWPDYTPEDLNEALIAYSQRSRRFGGV